MPHHYLHNLILQDKHALVCGGTQGIGKATAMQLAHLGANVTLLARDKETLDCQCRTLPKVHDTQNHRWIDADMHDLALLRQKTTLLNEELPIHIVINNSGGPASGAAHTAKPDQFMQAFQQHVLAAQIILQNVLASMKQAHFGRFINIISTSVKEPIRNLGVSNTVRGAMASWAKTLATELAPFGITVNNVLPGYTKTQRLQQIIENRMQATQQDEAQVIQSMLAHVPAARFAEPEEIAYTIAFLASPLASYINGVNLPVDGGRTQSL